MPQQFKREKRYAVIKLSDAEHLSAGDKDSLDRILRRATVIRTENGKQPLQCAVVESDWPEYEPVWKMIEDRVAGEDTPPPGFRPYQEPTASALAVQVGGGHYKDMKIQPVEFIHANGIGFLEGSAIKYLSRWRNKNGVEDLRKARHFIDLLIELEAAGAPIPAAAGIAQPAK